MEKRVDKSRRDFLRQGAGQAQGWGEMEFYPGAYAV